MQIFKEERTGTEECQFICKPKQNKIIFSKFFEFVNFLETETEQKCIRSFKSFFCLKQKLKLSFLFRLLVQKLHCFTICISNACKQRSVQHFFVLVHILAWIKSIFNMISTSIKKKTHSCFKQYSKKFFTCFFSYTYEVISFSLWICSFSLLLFYHFILF